MKKHFQNWGVAYILLVLWIGSWIGQAITMQSEIEKEGWTVFWAATFENWQSEWIQLLIQAIGLLALKHVIFKAEAEDQERLEAKVDALLERSAPSSTDA